MSKSKKDRNQDVVEMTEEMVAVEEVVTEEVPTAEQEWINNAGEVISKSAFIREKFNEDNMSRKEISDKFGIPYRTVYGATVNMVNAAEPSTRGRGVTNAKINVTADNKVVLTETLADGTVKHLLNGEEVESIEGLELTEVDRNEFIKAQVDAGVNRGDLAKYLGLSYGVIYGLTKDTEGGRSKHMITLEDGTEIARSEYIRQLVDNGVSKADIAKQLGVEYSVVWQATKRVKTDAEKYGEAVESISKFASVVTDADAFMAIVEMLKAVEIVVPATEEVIAE